MRSGYRNRTNDDIGFSGEERINGLPRNERVCAAVTLNQLHGFAKDATRVVDVRDGKFSPGHHRRTDYGEIAGNGQQRPDNERFG